MTTQWEVVGKSFVITGGASGLGAKYAEAFLKEGAKNVAILDISEDLGKATADKLNRIYPNKALFIKCDLGNESDIETAFNQVVDKFGRVDVIINNAGVMNDSPKIWWKSCAINYQGLVALTLKGIQHMSKEEGGAGGTIINISSVAALFKFKYLPVYSGSKMAVLHFSQTISAGPFFEETGIRILTLCLGATETPLLHNLADRTSDRMKGEEFEKLLRATPITQKTEYAVSAVLEMFRIGANSSVWCSERSKPIEDMTPIVEKHYKDFEHVGL